MNRVLERSRQVHLVARHLAQNRDRVLRPCTVRILGMVPVPRGLRRRIRRHGRQNLLSGIQVLEHMRFGDRMPDLRTLSPTRPLHSGREMKDFCMPFEASRRRRAQVFMKTPTRPLHSGREMKDFCMPFEASRRRRAQVFMKNVYFYVIPDSAFQDARVLAIGSCTLPPT